MGKSSCGSALVLLLRFCWRKRALGPLRSGRTAGPLSPHARLALGRLPWSRASVWCRGLAPLEPCPGGGKSPRRRRFMTSLAIGRPPMRRKCERGVRFWSDVRGPHIDRSGTARGSQLRGHTTFAHITHTQHTQQNHTTHTNARWRQAHAKVGYRCRGTCQTRAPLR